MWSASTRLQKEYGDFIKLRLLGKNIFICSNPEYLVTLLKLRDKCIPPQEIASEGIFLADGEKWQFARNILQHCFTDNSMRDFFTMFVRLSQEYCTQIEQFGTNPVKLIHYTETMMFKAICDVGLGMRDSSDTNALREEFGRAFDYLLEEQIKRQMRFAIFNSLPTSSNVKFNEEMEVLDNCLKKIIENPLTNSRTDLLAQMIRAEDPVTKRKFSTTELQHQIITLLVAGHKTSSLLLSWSIFEISQNPVVEKELKKELKKILKLDGTQKDPISPTFEQLKELKYMDMLLKETLRLHPRKLKI